MNQMTVESNKNYNYGFVLKEQEIRRLIDLVLGQFKKLSANPVELQFTIKFKNGAIATTDNIDEVFRLENEGTTSITRLQLATKQQKSEEEKSTIKIDFRNIDIEHNLNAPITHSIRGQSRDWVFVTSSLIEERISKSKRRSFDQIFSSNSGYFTPRLLILVTVMISVMAAFFSGIPKTVNKTGVQFEQGLNLIENKWKSKAILDPVDVIIQIEKLRNTANTKMGTFDFFSDMFFTKPLLVTIGAIILLSLVPAFMTKLYPPYNFCWGNYLDYFQKKEQIRKFVIGFIIVTIVVGILVNLAASYIWENVK